MLFNSMLFAVFFPTVLFFYFLSPFRYRWAVLLSASYLFYMAWEPGYIVLIAMSTLLDYFAGIRMERSSNKTVRQLLLSLSLLGNLGLLFFFKYYNFFSGEFDSLLGHLEVNYELPYSSFLLPVGISFYTFQTLSYTIEVYRGAQKAERHLGRFALYVAFFPQLVAGPIERAGNLLPQFLQKHTFDYRRVTDGLKLMAWGFFKKLVIADRLAILVNRAYNDPESHNGLSLAVATFFFAYQIYCDFSGYTDIAIGAARVMGFNLMKNFDRPYYSKSIGEFWRRWHISLSTWFRDYVYIPLGGNRVSIPRWYLNLMIVFIVSGLWHGANWTFIIWGALHGFYLVFSIISAPARNRLSDWLGLSSHPQLLKVLRTATTFGLVCFSWIFFRANSLSDALLIVRKIFTPTLYDPAGLQASLTLGLTNTFILSIFFIAVLEFYQLIERKFDVWEMVSAKPALFRWGIYYCLLLALIAFGVYDQTAFIYFQF